MSHLYGINFGNDQISGFDEIPLRYDYSDQNGKVHLTTRNEKIKKKKTEFADYNLDFGDKPLVRPPETFTSQCSNMADKYHDYILIFIILILFVMQYTTQLKVDMLVNMNHLKFAKQAT